VSSTEKVSSYRFGVFELDLRAAELRKNGVRLKLQEQPYQVLIKLLERPGEVVSREDLRSTLWPQDTFVDFETGLNTAIKRLRETVGDSADHPTFIETVPRRGYKFIAAVARSASDDREDPAFVKGQDSPTRKSRLARRWAAALVPFLLVGTIFWHRQPLAPTVANTVRLTNDFRVKFPVSPVTDGLYLYFVEGMAETTGSRIAQLSAAGGETTWIATNLPDPMLIFGISPDRRKLLVAGGEETKVLGTSQVWVQPLPAGTAHRVGNIAASSAAWTPDGRHILYAEGPTIALIKEDGTDPRTLAKVPGDARGIRFSPDGQRVRFWVATHNAESNSIWEMHAEGRNPHPLFPDWKQSFYQCCGNWSPDGEYYYFEAAAGNDQGIWVIPERRALFSRAPARPSLVSKGAALRFSAPLVSVEGKKLFVTGSEPRVELSRYDPHAQRFDPYLSGLSAGPVDFSYDGKWIAYVTYPDMTLWRSRIDGTDKMQLTFPPLRVYEPRWSPDGSVIAFMDMEFNRPWKILVLSSSGGSPELLVHDSTDDADPTWTPDGGSIMFGKSDGSTNRANISIYRMELKTGKRSSIADSKGIFSPRLSRDGRYISALSDDASKLLLFETATNRWSTLMEGAELSCNEWSHDGAYVYLRQIRDGVGEVVRVRIKNRVVEHFLSLKDFPQPTDPVSAWIGLTPDDALLLMRDRSIQELYALDLAFH
jgi:Tol biopolymer transport system component/DNA-binding winged helix-turn-helix (wHTH) protein